MISDEEAEEISKALIISLTRKLNSAYNEWTAENMEVLQNFPPTISVPLFKIATKMIIESQVKALEIMKAAGEL